MKEASEYRLYGLEIPAACDKISMTDEYDVSKIVTAFLLNSCRLPPWPSRIQAAMCIDVYMEEGKSSPEPGAREMPETVVGTVSRDVVAGELPNPPSNPRI